MVVNVETRRLPAQRGSVDRPGRAMGSGPETRQAQAEGVREQLARNGGMGWYRDKRVLEQRILIKMDNVTRFQSKGK